MEEKYTMEELVELLRLSDFSPVAKRADEIRKQTMGDTVHLRALLECSNYCSRRCTYCGIRADNHTVTRYRMSPEEIVSTAVEASEAGYKTIVLQSGEDAYFTPKLLGEIVSEIKCKTGMAITLGFGEMPYEAYAYLKQCGADRYLIKHETAHPRIYRALHPKTDLAERVRCLKDLKSLGYETGSGFMVGIPGQTFETLAKDLLLLREIPCDMAGIGPFIPHPMTPLATAQPGSTELTKRCVALARILLPKAHLPATTALGVRSRHEKNDVFSYGANVVMLKVTPTKYKRLYEIYPAPLPDTDISAQRKLLEEQILELGRVPV